MSRMKKVRGLQLDKSGAISMFTFLTRYHGWSEIYAKKANHLDLRELGFATIRTYDINKEDILRGNMLLVYDRTKRYEIYPNPFRMEREYIFESPEKDHLNSVKQKKLGGRI